MELITTCKRQSVEMTAQNLEFRYDNQEWEVFIDNYYGYGATIEEAVTDLSSNIEEEERQLVSCINGFVIEEVE